MYQELIILDDNILISLLQNFNWLFCLLETTEGNNVSYLLNVICVRFHLIKANTIRLFYGMLNPHLQVGSSPAFSIMEKIPIFWLRSWVGDPSSTIRPESSTTILSQLSRPDSRCWKTLPTIMTLNFIKLSI